MHIHALANILRNRFPGPLWELTRKVGNSLLGPLHFSLETGHLRSCLASRAMDRNGKPLPWYTYSAIQFLLTKDFSQKRVVEWGAGQSTFFWAEQAKEVVAFESDVAWYDHLRRFGPANARVYLISNGIQDADPLLGDEQFDVVVVDGLDRLRCIERSLNLVALNGVIIVDDAERDFGLVGGGGYADLYREAGLSRIDFYGYSPCNTTQHCTSMFFRESCFLIQGEKKPEVTLSFWKIGG